MRDRDKLRELGVLRGEPGQQRLRLSLCGPARLERLFAKVFDESEFLSPYGPRALSAYHREHPCAAEHAIRAADKPFLAYRAHVKTVQTRC